MCDDHGYPFIATLHNVLLAPDLCDGLFSIIAVINSGHNFLFYKGFCTVYFESKEKNAVTSPHGEKRKHNVLGEIQEMSKKKILPARKKIALELLHQRLGQQSTRSLLPGDTANVWEFI